MASKREEARLLRHQGKSVKEIARMLGLAPGSVSAWVKDIELSAEQREALRQRKRGLGKKTIETLLTQEERRSINRTYQQTGRIQARAKDPLHFAGCMLYWASGERTALSLSHHDPHLMQLFVRFLRDSLAVEVEMIEVSLDAPTKIEVHQSEAYWLDSLQLPKTCLKQTEIKPYRAFPHGICAISVDSIEALHHIYGAIQEYSGFENPDWLD